MSTDRAAGKRAYLVRLARKVYGRNLQFARWLKAVDQDGVATEGEFHQREDGRAIIHYQGARVRVLIELDRLEGLDRTWTLENVAVALLFLAAISALSSFNKSQSGASQ